MSEEIISSERLSTMIKKGAVENNVRKRGFQPRGDKEVMDVLYITHVDSKLKLSEGDEKGFTHLGIVPLSSPDISTEARGELNPGDMALCVAFHGLKVDEFSRNGTFRGVMIMSKEDTDLFIEAVLKNPELVYETFRKVNGGPIEKFDKKPVEIKPGEKVIILGNTSVGGEIVNSIASRPFKEDFDPNPLF